VTAGAGEAFASHPSLALGTEETTPLALATGYLTMARLGDRIEPWLVREVRGEDREGGSSPRPLSGTSVAPGALSRAASWMVLDAMTGSVERGTARSLAPLLAGRRVAAKTGTSQEGRDGWFALVSGNAVVLAWVGRDDAKPARLSGPSAALPVVRRLLEATGGELLGPLPEPPEGVVVGAYDPEKDCLGRSMRSGRVREVFPEHVAPRSCGGSFLRRLFGSEEETGR
jgi:membrane peptidoglycan carboxypeptidase